MIDPASFKQLKSQYPALASLPEKLQGLVSSELAPESNIQAVYSVGINGKAGCVLLLEEKLLAFWMMKMFFKKFPTIQEFRYSQVNQLRESDSTGLYLHASADPNVSDDNYEEGTFTFTSPADRSVVTKIIAERAPRLH